MKHVVASAAEAECGGLFKNGQLITEIRAILEALDHPQPATPLKTDNATAVGFANKNMRQKRSKSWDMRYHWLRCREAQHQLRIYWDKGKLNKFADYFTKHFPPKHHREMRSEILHVNNMLVSKDQNKRYRNQVIKQDIAHILPRLSERLQGCVESPPRSTVTLTSSNDSQKSFLRVTDRIR